MKLTWNQRRALENLVQYPSGASSGMLADMGVRIHPYLCGASARTAVMALVRKGLAEIVSAGTPMRFRITSEGQLLLVEDGEKYGTD